MVVSGLPQETNRHVVEICNMALDLLSVVRTFKIKHRPNMMLMLRIGIHSGPCAAGDVSFVSINFQFNHIYSINCHYFVILPLFI